MTTVFRGSTNTTVNVAFILRRCIQQYSNSYLAIYKIYSIQWVQKGLSLVLGDTLQIYSYIVSRVWNPLVNLKCGWNKKNRSTMNNKTAIVSYRMQTIYILDRDCLWKLQPSWEYLLLVDRFMNIPITLRSFVAGRFFCNNKVSLTTWNRLFPEKPIAVFLIRNCRSSVTP